MHIYMKKNNLQDIANYCCTLCKIVVQLLYGLENILHSLKLFRPTKTRVYPEIKEHRRMFLFFNHFEKGERRDGISHNFD